MKLKLILTFNFLILFLDCFCQGNIAITHELYHQYQGDFVFEDGIYITGGPMGEIKGSVLYLDPVNSHLGGIFIPVNKTTFSSAFPPGSKSKIEFKINKKKTVEGMWWTNEKGEKKYAKKEISPIVHKVNFDNGDIALAGELILPKGEGPFPVIINVHGSGRQDRHDGPWSSFFTRYGIAVLSYDKRGVGESTGRYETAGYEDLASDVLTGISFLKNHPKINAELIGIQGSSEGGWVGSIAASKSEDVAFLLVRVGSGVSGFETYMHEIKNELAEKDLSKQEWVEAVKLERAYYNLALSNVSIDSINSFIRMARSKYDWFEDAFNGWDHLDPEYRIKMRETGPIDPVDSLRNITIPVLWFLADEDENVPYALSEPRIKLALEEAGNEDYQVVTIKGVKHNFILQNKDGSSKYVDGYWDKMADWLQKRGFTKY
ncbi:alpha/beta hydrolase [Flavobacteriaceae bacterium KMM 6898]|nr:alpha/beta hydrolase [Flavobacteriaceae bacterium KMM 6898]